MKRADVARLVLLAAIWGASFLLTRITAPVLGPVATADLRMLIGGLALAAWFAALRFDPQWRSWWLPYLVVGMFTSGLPFLLFAGLMVWMYWTLAHKPGGQPIGALERVFARISRRFRKLFRRRGPPEAAQA